MDDDNFVGIDTALIATLFFAIRVDLRSTIITAVAYLLVDSLYLPKVL